MVSRVLISKKLIADFRKRVIAAYPNETMQTLWGRVEGDTVVVSSLRTPKQEGTKDELLYHFGDAVGAQSVVRGEHYLGTIHSHPECLDATPSQHDWDTSYTSGERIFGIMRCERGDGGRYKTETKFWEPRPEIAIVHPRVRDANRDKQLEVESEAMPKLQKISGATTPSVSVSSVLPPLCSTTDK